MKPLHNLALLALLLATGRLATAQPPAAVPPDGAFTESVDVRVVNVDVHVTDRDGRPVAGLRREDFEVFEDGRPVEVVNFSEVAEPAPPPAMASESPAPAAPAPAEAAAAPHPPLYLAVYIDNANLRPASRNRVLSQLQAFLISQVGPQDRLMLVTNDLGLHVRRPFSAGTSGLEAELKEVARLAAPGELREIGTRRLLSRIHEDGCRDDVVEEVRAYTRDAYNQDALGLSNLQGFVESLAELDARKAVLYVSDGLPLYAGDEVLRVLAQVCGGSGPANSIVGGFNDLSSRLRRLTTAANASRVTFYTLEARGLRNFTSSTVEYAQSIITPEMDFATRANLQDGLYNLADETGGRAVLEANDLLPDLRRIATELRSYYSLGYAPRHPVDGRIHDIRVEVKREHLRVRHRSSYREASLEDRLRGRVLAALLHGEEENPLDVEVEAGVPEKQAKNLWLVPIRLRMPTGRLTLLPKGDSYEGKLRIVVGAQDAAGHSAPVLQVAVPLRVPTAAMAGLARKPFVYDLKLEMRSGEQTLAIGVYDEVARSGSFLVRGVRVDKGGARLDPAVR